MDAYDSAIQHFNEHPDELEAGWSEPATHRYGFLFGFLTPSRRSEHREDGKMCGCPTTVKTAVDLSDFHIGKAYGWTDELTIAIQSDETIPRWFGSMLTSARLESLPAIANAQRLADKMLGREEPNPAKLDVGASI